MLLFLLHLLDLFSQIGRVQGCLTYYFESLMHHLELGLQLLVLLCDPLDLGVLGELHWDLDVDQILPQIGPLLEQLQIR